MSAIPNRLICKIAVFMCCLTTPVWAQTTKVLLVDRNATGTPVDGTNFVLYDGFAGIGPPMADAALESRL
ncbi:MAG: hypothetical protein HOP29_18425 [Phycisphaerales bacterium]|nr:hypothetical protein [Phycisphaerales bacterium]